MFDVSNFTLNPKEVQKASELIVEKGFKTGRLSELFDVTTGIDIKQQIGFVKGLGIGGGKATGCVPKNVGNIELAEKYWDPAIVTGRLTYCANDENQLLKILAKWTNIYPDFFETITDDVMKLTTALLIDHIEASVIAKAFFSDKAADTFANGGTFTNGTDLDVFNQFDGQFKQILSDGSIPYHKIVENDGAAYADQKLNNNKAYHIVEAVFDQADERLKGDPNGIIYVTPDIFWGYAKKISEIEGAGGVTSTIIGGREAFSYMGKTIVNMVDWASVIKTYKNDGTKYSYPNIAVFTTKENLPIGTMSTNDLKNLRQAFDYKDNEVLIDYGYTLDAKVLLPYMISVAY